MSLSNRVFISTRPSGNKDTLAQLLQNEGAKVLAMPLIQVSAKPVDNYILDAVNHLASYNWIVFTSHNGVQSFFSHLYQIAGTDKLPSQIQCAVVGAKTGQVLASFGASPAITGSGNTSKELLQDLIDLKLHSQTKILLVLGNLASDLLETGLRNHYQVQRVDVYETVPATELNPDAVEALATDKYDMVLFTSPSGFESYIQLCSNYRMPDQLKIGCIGPTTARAVESHGIKPLVVAAESNAEGMCKAIIEYYNTVNV